MTFPLLNFEYEEIFQNFHLTKASHRLWTLFSCFVSSALEKLHFSLKVK